MKSIEIVKDNQKAIFTPRAVELDGETFEYASLLVIQHRPAEHQYIISDGLRTGSISYDEKDAKAMQTLISRIAQLRNIGIEVSGPASVISPAELPDAASAQAGTTPIDETAAPTQKGTAPTEKDTAAEVPPEPAVSSKQTDLLQRPVFLIVEIVIAAFLLAIGIYLFFIAY